MQDIWQRIDTWLAENAPELAESLNPGATDQAITEAEQFFGVTFPDDFRASLRIHDGQRDGHSFFSEYGALLPLAQMQYQWSIWKGLHDSGDFAGLECEPEGPIRKNWWHPQWIPLTYDGAGNHLSLDLAPAEDGTVGQLLMMWHDDSTRPLIASSFREWLTGIAGDLEDGHLEYSEDDRTLLPRVASR